jgi:hypothetical protein
MYKVNINFDNIHKYSNTEKYTKLKRRSNLITLSFPVKTSSKYNQNQVLKVVKMISHKKKKDKQVHCKQNKLQRKEGEERKQKRTKKEELE